MHKKAKRFDLMFKKCDNLLNWMKFWVIISFEILITVLYTVAYAILRNNLRLCQHQKNSEYWLNTPLGLVNSITENDEDIFALDLEEWNKPHRQSINLHWLSPYFWSVHIWTNTLCMWYFYSGNLYTY